MSDPVEPRRWMLTGLRFQGKGDDRIGVLPEIDPKLELDEKVCVREDTATEADIEAVAIYFDDHGIGQDAEDARAMARSLLSTIFKD